SVAKQASHVGFCGVTGLLCTSRPVLPLGAFLPAEGSLWLFCGVPRHWPCYPVTTVFLGVTG
ncbi:MAG: hypothetical protein Q7U74_12710, partial [Saprospiraceae bacterium]|nr:hypothetical protein [Saprospiraceae bacterium]